MSQTLIDAICLIGLGIAYIGGATFLSVCAVAAGMKAKECHARLTR